MHNHIWVTVISFHTMVMYIPLAAAILFLRPALWPHTLAVFGGLLAGFANLQGAQNQLIALLLIAFPFFVGFSHPEKAWRWALLTGLWVPISENIRIWITTPGQWHIVDPSIFLVLGFSFLGAYIGVGLQRLRPKVWGPSVATETEMHGS